MTPTTTSNLTRQVLVLEAGQVAILVPIHPELILDLELSPAIRLEKEWGQIQVKNGIYPPALEISIYLY